MRRGVRETLGMCLAGDELLQLRAGLGVLDLHRRRLHEVRRRGKDRTTDAAVEGDLAATQPYDDDPRRVGGVPDLELVLHVQRHVAERTTLETHVGPLA